MRKSDREPVKNSKLKFRVIEVEVEGDDATMHEGLRSIQAAIARPRSPGVPTKFIAAGSGPISVTEAPATVDDELESPQTEMKFETEAPQPDGDVAAATSSRRPTQPRRVSTPKPLDDFDITSGPVSLDSFVKEKAPENIQRTFLVITYWLKEHRNTPVTASHVYTCYRMLGLNPPKDIYTPLKDMRAKRKWLDKGDGESEYKLNPIGKSEVDRMGPQKAQ